MFSYLSLIMLFQSPIIVQDFTDKYFVKTINITKKRFCHHHQDASVTSDMEC